MLPEELHKELCAALERVGGIACEKLIPDAQATQADILFEELGIFVEVKTLTEDRNKRKETREKAGKIVHEGAKDGGPVIFGEVSLQLSELPRATAERLLLNIGDRIRKNLRDASHQIKASATRLGLPARGMVLFGVPTHFSTNPGVIATVAARILHPARSRAIEGLMIISVPTVNATAACRPVLSFSPRQHSSIPPSLIDRIAEGWITHISEISGHTFTGEERDEEAFETEFLIDDDDWPK